MCIYNVYTVLEDSNIGNQFGGSNGDLRTGVTSSYSSGLLEAIIMCSIWIFQIPS